MNRVARVHGQSPRERTTGVFAWQAPSNRCPEDLHSCWRHAHVPHTVQPARHETRLGYLARDRPKLLVELDLEHPLLDFGQPPILRSALPRRPCSVRVDAQDARVRDDPHAFGTFLLVKAKSMHRETVAGQRERERRKRRFCDQCCRVDADSQRISILMNEISEKTWNEELNRPFLVIGHSWRSGYGGSGVP